MTITNLLSDEAILCELGSRILHYRVERQITQATLAEQAGVSKRTVERIESGQSSQMISIIKILRVLELLPNLELAIPQPKQSPLALLKQQGKTRQRASKNSDAKETNAQWTWGK